MERPAAREHNDRPSTSGSERWLWSDNPNKSGGFSGAIQAHWGLFLAEGIILVILGVAAIALPLIATLAFTIIIGWIFLVSGSSD